VVLDKAKTLEEAMYFAFKEEGKFPASQCFGFYQDKKPGGEGDVFSFLLMDSSWNTVSDAPAIDQPWRYMNTESQVVYGASYNPGKMFIVDTTFTGKLYIKNKLVNCSYENDYVGNQYGGIPLTDLTSPPRSNSTDKGAFPIFVLAFACLLVIICPMIILMFL
jgi:hypothetical protein